MLTPQAFIVNVQGWASQQPDIVALALIGSFARGTATSESDIDFVLLTPKWADYLVDLVWTELFGEVKMTQIEDYGAVKSLRVWYEDGLEVEFSLTEPEWAGLPIEPGTHQVLNDGFEILYDPAGLLKTATDAL